MYDSMDVCICAHTHTDTCPSGFPITIKMSPSLWASCSGSAVCFSSVRSSDSCGRAGAACGRTCGALAWPNRRHAWPTSASQKSCHVQIAHVGSVPETSGCGSKRGTQNGPWYMEPKTKTCRLLVDLFDPYPSSKGMCGVEPGVQEPSADCRRTSPKGRDPRPWHGHRAVL